MIHHSSSIWAHESEKRSSTGGACIVEKILKQLIMRNSQGDLHMPEIKELFKVKSFWAAWAAARWRELRSSHQFAITFRKWEHEIVDSLFQFKANKIKWFFLVPLIWDLAEEKKNQKKNFSYHMQLGVIYDSLSIKAFNTNSGGNKQIVTVWGKRSWITLTWSPKRHRGSAFNSVQQFQ